MTPSMPYEHFKVLVKCQRKNGVHLIQGCDNGRATRGLSAMADTVREKVAAILVDANHTVRQLTSKENGIGYEAHPN